MCSNSIRGSLRGTSTTLDIIGFATPFFSSFLFDKGLMYYRLPKNLGGRFFMGNHSSCFVCKGSLSGAVKSGLVEQMIEAKSRKKERKRLRLQKLTLLEGKIKKKKIEPMFLSVRCMSWIEPSFLESEPAWTVHHMRVVTWG